MRARIAIAALLFAALAAPVLAGQVHRFNLDSANSAVSARVSFFGIASKTAQFPDIAGDIQLDPARPGPIELDVILNARALKASDNATLGRLKGPHFFDVDHYPTIRFAGRTLHMTGQRTADVDGELTARGVTRREVLHVIFEREPAQISGREPVSFTAIMAIDRRTYGMNAYSLIVGNRVTIAIRARMLPS